MFLFKCQQGKEYILKTLILIYLLPRPPPLSYGEKILFITHGMWTLMQILVITNFTINCVSKIVRSVKTLFHWLNSLKGSVNVISHDLLFCRIYNLQRYPSKLCLIKYEKDIHVFDLEKWLYSTVGSLW